MMKFLTLWKDEGSRLTTLINKDSISGIVNGRNILKMLVTSYGT